MMNAEKYNENDIEILDKGISVQGSFLSKKQIADILNGYILYAGAIKV